LPSLPLRSFSFAPARSYAVYNDALHSAILLLKYEQVIRLGNWFAAKPAEVVARDPDHFQSDVVVPPRRSLTAFESVATTRRI
jgi:predicted amidophosphoribosyltransferase